MKLTEFVQILRTQIIDNFEFDMNNKISLAADKGKDLDNRNFKEWINCFKNYLRRRK